MEVLLDTIPTHVSEMPLRLATGINALRPYMDLLSPHRWGLTLVRTESDAADPALCKAARDFIRRSATDLFVVSGDHSLYSAGCTCQSPRHESHQPSEQGASL